MRKFKAKFRGARNFILGMLVMASIFGCISAVSAAANRRNITVEYGYKLYVDGVLFEPTDRHGVIEPMNYNGWIWAPFEHIAKALDKEAYWDGATRSLYLGRRTPVGTRIPLHQAAPFFDRSPNAEPNQRNNSAVWHGDAVMGGTTYSNAVIIRRVLSGGAGTQFSLHNLNRNYRRLTGNIGRVDGSLMQDVTINIIGDGRTLQSYNLSASDMPTSISVDISNIQQLRFEVIFPESSGYSSYNTEENSRTYAIAAFLE